MTLSREPFATSASPPWRARADRARQVVRPPLSRSRRGRSALSCALAADDADLPACWRRSRSWRSRWLYLGPAAPPDELRRGRLHPRRRPADDGRTDVDVERPAPACASRSSRSNRMNDDLRSVLQMLAEGKISADEAERLISALERNDASTRQAGGAPAGRNQPPKYLAGRGGHR